jgi:general secretion pathway protein M
MSNANAALPPPLAAREQASRFWQGRAPRERQLIVLTALAVAALAAWLTLVGPALRVLREAPLERDRLDQQMQELQLAAGEIPALRAASPVPTERATTALRSATAQLGDKARLSVQGDRATLNFTSVPSEALRAWLGEARSGARARPLEAQLVKAAGGYSGSIVVSLGSAS